MAFRPLRGGGGCGLHSVKRGGGEMQLAPHKEGGDVDFTP